MSALIPISNQERICREQFANRKHYFQFARNTLGISPKKRNVFAFHFYASLKDHGDLLHADTHSTRQRDLPQSPKFAALWRRALFQEN